MTIRRQQYRLQPSWSIASLELNRQFYQLDTIEDEDWLTPPLFLQQEA
jgi:hypothetical protein